MEWKAYEVSYDTLFRTFFLFFILRMARNFIIYINLRKFEVQKESKFSVWNMEKCQIFTETKIPASKNLIRSPPAKRVKNLTTVRETF